MSTDRSWPNPVGWHRGGGRLADADPKQTKNSEDGTSTVRLDHEFNVRQIGKYLVIAFIPLQRLDYDRQRFSPEFWQIPFLRFSSGKCQGFCWGAELCVHSRLVSASIEAMPAEILKVDGIQSVQSTCV